MQTGLLIRGSVMHFSRHDPFGDTLRSTGPRASGNPWRFSTKYTDQESGWLYYGYRYYEPKLGRWVSRDPVQEIGGNAPYRFVDNCSLSKADLLGLLSNCECFLMNTVVHETLPMYVDLLARNCLKGMRCTKRSYGGVFNLSTRIIELSEGATADELAETIKHELQHAYDTCDQTALKSCSDCLHKEARAQFCSGRPKFDLVMAWGSCKQLCNDPSKIREFGIEAERLFGGMRREECVTSIKFPPIGLR